jgi:hypothetical protein
MAVLLDRIARDPKLPASERVAGHRVETALVLYFHDKITRAQLISYFNIPPAMQADFDQFKARYASFGTTAVQLELRNQYVQDVQACVVALQFGDITKAQFNTFTGLNLATTG